MTIVFSQRRRVHGEVRSNARGGMIMHKGFNAREVFEMAVSIERQGEIFYTKASGMFDDPQVRSMLAELASMEAEHEKIFLSMREEFTGHERYSSGYDPDDLAVSYLRAMTSGEVFGVMAPLSGTESLSDVLSRGIEAEKESIVFYTGLKGIVPEVLGREKIDRIIEEEMRHIVILSEKRSFHKE